MPKSKTRNFSARVAQDIAGIAEDGDETVDEHEDTEEAAAPASTYDTDHPSPADLKRVQVRGEPDDEKKHKQLSKWEAWVQADAAANGGLLTPASSSDGHATTARLLERPAPPPPPSDTETELNGLIAECRYLMREVAFNSARLTYNPDDRIRFLSSAQNLAITGAAIGKTVARLRSAGLAPPTPEHRQRITVEHVQIAPGGIQITRPAPEGEGGGPGLTDSANQ